MENLPVNGLEFDEIKSNFINYLKKDEFYKDYMFQSSGINILLNILTYNTHYMTYYMKMLINESFVDSATLRETLMSKAKLNGYIPRGKTSSKAIAQISFTLDISEDVSNGVFPIPRSSNFKAANRNNDTRFFYILDDVSCYTRELFQDPENNTTIVKYTSPEIVAYEGRLESWRYLVDKTDIQQRFVVKDRNVDVDTFRVYVYKNVDIINNCPETKDPREQFFRSDTFNNIDPQSKVFYLSTNEEGLYEIIFGNNIFGEDLDHGNVVEIFYISTNGESGNGCKNLRYQYGSEGDFVELKSHSASSIKHETKIKAETSGGTDEEDIESLRYNIQHHFKRQNRVINESDYESILIQNFSNIDSINVWGGERNEERDYNTVYVSIKPKNGQRLNDTTKNNVRELLDKYVTVNKRLKIMDPVFLYIDSIFNVIVDPVKTDDNYGKVERQILNVVADYNETELQRFGVNYSEVDILDYIRDKVPAVKSLYTTKTLTKTYGHVHKMNTVYKIKFANSIVPGSVSGTEVMFNEEPHRIVDTGGQIDIVNKYNSGIRVTIGKINYITGLIVIQTNNDIRTLNNPSNVSNISLTCKPKYPDILTTENNIVQIRNTKVLFVSK